jgi:hypothetical protein
MDKPFAPLQADDLIFEQRLFVWSPFGAVATSFIIFVLAVGSFVVLALLTHYPLVDARGFVIAPNVIPAVAISLLLSTTLGMQRYTRLKELADRGALALIVSDRAAPFLAAKPVSAAAMTWATAAGALAGVALELVVVPHWLLRAYPAIFAWHVVFTIILVAFFCRGVLSVIRSGRAFSHLVEHELVIDLLRVDRLDVIGRRCARNALIWFTAAAVTCLFFVGGGIDESTIAILAICIGLGLWIFLRQVIHVHRKIRAAKLVQLDRIRSDIEPLRAAAAQDASAATRLQGLLAYEARIQAAHEWPFDHTTVARVGAYVLIPALPWLGKAALGSLMERLAP